MTTQRNETEHVASAIAALAGHAPDGFVLVAIDGPGGAGKSTLATAVAEALGGAERTTIVHVDDFYRPMAPEERLLLGPEEGYHRYFDWQRLRDQVLVPLVAGRAADYQRYDWATGAPAPDELRHVPRSGTVIVEGVFTARPELAAYYDLTVSVETPRDTCLHRQYARGHDHGPGNWVDRWRAAEEHYLTTTCLGDRADLTVKGC